MNLAVPGFLILLALLPGIVFLNRYLSGRFPKGYLSISTVSELSTYVLLSVPFVTLWVWFFKREGHSGGLSAVVSLLLGNMTPDQAVTVQASLVDNWGDYALKYMVLLAVAWISGSVLRRLVWAFRLDTRIRFLRMHHEWYYLLLSRFRGQSPHLIPVADVLASHPEHGSILYRGFVDRFELDDRGCIRELVLRYAERCKSKPGSGDDPVKWKDIPGFSFVIMGSIIQSINIRYFFRSAPKTRWERVKLGLSRFKIALLWEEP